MLKLYVLRRSDTTEILAADTSDDTMCSTSVNVIDWTVLYWRRVYMRCGVKNISEKSHTRQVAIAYNGLCYAYERCLEINRKWLKEMFKITMINPFRRRLFSHLSEESQNDDLCLESRLDSLNFITVPTYWL